MPIHLLTHLHFIFRGIVSPGDDPASLFEITPASLKGELVFLTLFACLFLTKCDNITAFSHMENIVLYHAVSAWLVQ